MAPRGTPPRIDFLWVQKCLDDRQITHLICVRLKLLLYDSLGGVLGLLPVVFLYKRPKTPPKESYSKSFRHTD